MIEKDKIKYNDKIMAYLETNQIITIREMAEVLDISYYRTERLLNNLAIEGKLKKNFFKKSRVTIFIKIPDILTEKL